MLADNRASPSNKTLDESLYDDYYEYDEDETSDKVNLVDEEDYVDEYTDSGQMAMDGSKALRKLGVCPKVVEAVGQCDVEKSAQPDCRFDNDCIGEMKCCAAACGRRVCNTPIQSKSMSRPAIRSIGHRTDTFHS